MSRSFRPAAFRQHEVTRALRAAAAAGLEVSGYEIDPTTGKIMINTNALKTSSSAGADFLAKWMAKHKG